MEEVVSSHKVIQKGQKQSRDVVTKSKTVRLLRTLCKKKTASVSSHDPFKGITVFVCQLLSHNFNLIAAPGISGWNFNILNVTEKSFYVQWQGLTNEISQPVKGYIIHVSWSNHYGGYETAGKILPLNVTSAIIDGLDGFSDYTVVVFGVDGLGNPHKSSATNVKTLEGCECLFCLILVWLESCVMYLSDNCKRTHG